MAPIYLAAGSWKLKLRVILVGPELGFIGHFRSLAHKSFLFRYDFDRDGYIIQEDVRLVLSHVPIENKVVGHVAQEGVFTSTGGGR